MYIEVNNPNEEIRNWICDKFNNSDISDIEVVSKIVETFIEISQGSPDMYEYVLRVIYQDYFVEQNYLVRKYKLCKNFEELLELIDNNPTFIITMLQSEFNFFNKSYFDKKITLLKNKRYSEYLMSINSFSFFDFLYYCREFSKEDLLNCYYDSYCEYDEMDEEDREIYALDEVEDLLHELYNVDVKNYFLLTKQILTEAYYYIKYESSKRKLKKYEYKLISEIEKNKFESLRFGTIQEEILFSDVLYCFIEYNKKEEKEQLAIKKKIINKSDKTIFLMSDL